MNQIEATARFWFAYLEQDEYWLPKAGNKVRVADMDTGWAGNAGRWLDRRAEIVETYYTHGELSVLGDPVPVVIGERVVIGKEEREPVEVFRPDSNMMPAEGSMAELAFQREQDERAEDPVAWLATAPLRRALAARAAGGRA